MVQSHTEPGLLYSQQSGSQHHTLSLFQVVSHGFNSLMVSIANPVSLAPALKHEWLVGEHLEKKF